MQQGVAAGGAGSAAFLQLASGYLTSPEEVDPLRSALLAYCHRDNPRYGRVAPGIDMLGASMNGEQTSTEVGVGNPNPLAPTIPETVYRTIPASRAVRRANGVVSSGRRSAKIRLSHRSFRHRQWVIRARTETGLPCAERSWRVRRYEL
jgi:hypothetical protein